MAQTTLSIKRSTAMDNYKLGPEQKILGIENLRRSIDYRKLHINVQSKVGSYNNSSVMLTEPTDNNQYLSTVVGSMNIDVTPNL